MPPPLYKVRLCGPVKQHRRRVWASKRVNCLALIGKVHCHRALNMVDGINASQLMSKNVIADNPAIAKSALNLP